MGRTMAMEFLGLIMGLVTMREIFWIFVFMGMACSYMKMVMFMKAIGRMISEVGMEYFNIEMETDTKVSGSTIKKMDSGK